MPKKAWKGGGAQTKRGRSKGGDGEASKAWGALKSSQRRLRSEE